MSESKRLAVAIHLFLQKQELRMLVCWEQLAVLRETAKPAVLLELGYRIISPKTNKSEIATTKINWSQAS